MYRKLALAPLVLMLAGCAAPSFNLSEISITPPPLQSAVLEISYSESGTGDVNMQKAIYETYTLECNSDGTALGTHPTPEEACNHLAKNRMLYQNRQVNDQMACTMIYGGPQLAYVEGFINGRDFNISLDRRDGCAISTWDSWIPIIPMASSNFIDERYPGTSFTTPEFAPID
jgi:hypothetical protein